MKTMVIIRRSVHPAHNVKNLYVEDCSTFLMPWSNEDYNAKAPLKALCNYVKQLMDYPGEYNINIVPKSKCAANINWCQRNGKAKVILCKNGEPLESFEWKAADTNELYWM